MHAFCSKLSCVPICGDMFNTEIGYVRCHTKHFPCCWCWKPPGYGPDAVNPILYQEDFCCIYCLQPIISWILCNEGSPPCFGPTYNCCVRFASPWFGHTYNFSKASNTPCFGPTFNCCRVGLALMYKIRSQIQG